VNARYTEGQSTSLRLGIASLGDTARAAVIALGDQPSVDAAVIDALIARHRDTHQPIVAPHYQDVRGNPVLFDASVFAELDGVCGDRGARDVIAREPERVAWVELDVPMPRGIDVPEDLEALERCWPPHGSMRPV
jgi:molybdenum cofactor cytidylyltransferase